MPGAITEVHLFASAAPMGEPAGRVVDARGEAFQGRVLGRLGFALEAEVELRADEADQGFQVGGDFDRQALQAQLAEGLRDHVA